MPRSGSQGESTKAKSAQHLQFRVPWSGRSGHSAYERAHVLAGERSFARTWKGGRAMRRLLTVEEAAEYSGLSVRYLRRLIFERRVAYHKDKRRVWLAQADLDAYMNSLRVEPQGDPALSSRRSDGRLANTRGRR